MILRSKEIIGAVKFLSWLGLICLPSSVAVLWLLGPCSDGAWGGPRAKPFPEFATVQSSINRDLANQTDYQTGDILSQSYVAPIIKHLELMGWKIADRKTILKKVPSDTHFLVRQLRTKAGREFMRKVASYPLAYDRLYRLALLPDGRRTMVDLIRAKDGHKMIQYLTTSKGGKNLGKILQRLPKGTEFNTPTGHIFTGDQLIGHLKQSYQAELKRRAERRAKSIPEK